MKNRTLYFGDNLEILRKKIADDSFDLIYLDPPFNSNRNYNVLFKEGVQDSPAQVHAFEDSWHWSHESKGSFDRLVTKTNENISNLMLALEKTIGHNDMLAYLTMMSVRLIELHRVLKKTGSIYLHCDPTASHYLKIVMDVIFGKENFRNEIIWKRVTSSKSQSITFTKSHDVLLFYSKTDTFIYEKPYGEYNEDYIRNFYKFTDEKGRKYRLSDFTQQGQGPKRYFGEKYGWKEPPVGKHWIWSQEKIDEGLKKNLFYFSKNGSPSIKRYLDEKKGQPVDDIWTDIFNIQGSSVESLRYPTQKPEALLERIIKASSKEGDWILDPFCGCGTTVSAAEKLKRNWVGIDVTALAINLIKHRLNKQFSLGAKQIYIDGLPTDLNGAEELFKKDPFEFEYWALDLVNAMPAKSKSKENMKGADKGVDGVITFVKNVSKEDYEYGKLIVQIKGGGVQRSQIATLKGDIEREKADGGLFITLEKPTKSMISEAVDAGSYKVPFTKEEFPKIQILTVEDLLDSGKPNIPLGFAKNYFKEAKAVEVEDNPAQFSLGL